MKNALLFGLTMLLSGCFPYRYTLTQPVQGTVISTISNKPIENAMVSIESGRQGSIYYRKAELRTDSEGKFAFPELRAWGVWLLPQEPYIPQATLSCGAPGYGKTELQIGPTEAGGPVICSLLEKP